MSGFLPCYRSEAKAAVAGSSAADHWDQQHQADAAMADEPEPEGLDGLMTAVSTIRAYPASTDQAVLDQVRCSYHLPRGKRESIYLL